MAAFNELIWIIDVICVMGVTCAAALFLLELSFEYCLMPTMATMAAAAAWA